MTIHSLKIEAQYLDALVKGTKKAEVRYNDRNYQVDDILAFGNLWFRVTHVHKGLGLRSNYVMLSVEPEEATP